MVNEGPPLPHRSVRCRQIADSDVEAIVDLLKKGFGRQRSHRFWQRVLAVLASRPTSAGLPKFGWLLESEGRPVGVILLIFSTRQEGGEATVRCNVSSWYVEPEFRSFGSLLISQALKTKTVTYLNISPAPHTWRLLDAQGYSRYSNGLLVSLPMLNAAPAGAVRLLRADAQLEHEVDAAERELLLAHEAYGCISRWCETADGTYPFVFVPRLVKGVLPCFQLVYCRQVSDFVRFARPLGRFLAWRGRPIVIVDANGPVNGLTGWYFDGIRPKYFKGAHEPRLGDLADTEAALFGI